MEMKRWGLDSQCCVFVLDMTVDLNALLPLWQSYGCPSIFTFRTWNCALLMIFPWVISTIVPIMPLVTHVARRIANIACISSPASAFGMWKEIWCISAFGVCMQQLSLCAQSWWQFDASSRFRNTLFYHKKIARTRIDSRRSGCCFVVVHDLVHKYLHVVASNKV